MRRRWLLEWAFATFAGLVLAAGVAAGHVRYVTDTDEFGDGLSFLASALTDPINVAILSGGGLATVLVLALTLRFRPFQRDVEVFRDVMASYRDLIPWLLRLGFGLPLVGAGFAGYLFVPVLEPNIEWLARISQIALGFALLFGLATRVAAALGLISYFIVLPFEPVVLFSLEWIPGFLAIMLVGSGRPSADHTLYYIAAAEGTTYGKFDPVHAVAESFNSKIDPYERFVPLVIRAGMGVAFVFLGLFEKLLAPEMARNVVARYGLAEVTPVPPDLWILGAGFAELGIGLALLFGLFTRLSALTALAVFTLTLFALPDDPVLAHIGLFSLASTLLITGAGPYALDNRIGALKPSARWSPLATSDD